MNLPAGLLDKNIEFFFQDDEPYVIQDGSVKSYHTASIVRIMVRKDMFEHKDLVSKLMKLGYHGYDLEVKWIFCRYGGLDNIPDLVPETNQRNPEYHDCPSRATCKLSGELCRIPEGLSHRELETIKAIATGKPAKAAADDMNVTFHTFREFSKKAYKKAKVHSRADIMNFAYHHNII